MQPTSLAVGIAVVAIVIVGVRLARGHGALGHPMHDVLSWGILGCGDVTEKKSGPAAFNSADGKSQVVAVMRRQAALARDYALRHGVPAWTAQSAELVNNPTVNAVYIASPPGSHLELALAVASARKPCIVEKPMARNLAESRAMSEAFRAQGVPLFVAYYRRAYPRIIRLKQLVGSGAVGRVLEVTYSFSSPRKARPGWRVDAAVSGGGLFVDVGSHALDLLDFVIGPLRHVSGVARGPQGEVGAVEEFVHAKFRFDCGAVGEAIWDFAAASSEDTLTIVGSTGRVTVPLLMNGDTIQVETDREADSSHAAKYVDPPPPVVQRPFVASVIEALQAGDKALCASTAESGLRTAAVMDAILDTYYGGRADAFWERPSTWPQQQ